MQSETVTTLGVDDRTPEQMREEAHVAFSHLLLECRKFAEQRTTDVLDLEQAVQWYRRVEKWRYLA